VGKFYLQKTLHSKFNLSSISRSWLKKKTVNAFSHCLKRAKFNIDDAARAYHNMLMQHYCLQGGRFIIDDTMSKHTKLCRFIYGVCKHWDHVFNTMTAAKCLVFLYYSENGVIKFPIGWKIYFRNSNTTKNDLAIELIEEALEKGFKCSVVLADSWFCVNPFIKELQRLKLRYVLEAKTNTSVKVKIKKKETTGRGRKRKNWYTKENIVNFMKKGKNKREIGFKENLSMEKAEKLLYILKERVAILNSFSGKHKIIYSYDPKRESEKYLITNELTWEGIKIVKEYFHRWVIEEFFRNAKQQLNMEGACVRSEQGVTITLLLVSFIDSLFHKEIAKLVSKNLQSEPITVQSIVRLAEIENVENLAKLIKSPKGDAFLKKWIKHLKDNALIKRKVKSEVIYLDQKVDGINEELKDVA
jgi:hypothetical protein